MMEENLVRIYKAIPSKTKKGGNNQRSHDRSLDLLGPGKSPGAISHVVEITSASVHVVRQRFLPAQFKMLDRLLHQRRLLLELRPLVPQPPSLCILPV